MEKFSVHDFSTVFGCNIVWNKSMFHYGHTITGNCCKWFLFVPLDERINSQAKVIKTVTKTIVQLMHLNIWALEHARMMRSLHACFSNFSNIISRPMWHVSDFWVNYFHFSRNWMRFTKWNQNETSKCLANHRNSETYVWRDGNAFYKPRAIFMRCEPSSG